ncbi:MAG: sigma-54-dependent Fis family transcriptional regulator [Bacteroidetes bacterium]|nr:sigma-54-dependent Fis family transcriptional regulator [Bacteroidota bacterium]MBX7045605.1 sigma-54 dependent transcriptional regulator [Ignavibacteria bacterium]
MSKILIVDDEQSIVDSISMILNQDDYEIDSANDGLSAVNKVKSNFYDLILLDIKMPKMDGIEALEKIKEIDKDAVVIMISGHGTIETAVEATKKGAYNFLQKPLPDLYEFKLIIKNAIGFKKSLDELKKYKEKALEESKIVGSSEKIKEVNNLIDKYSKVNSHVLICGESGTGKELAARQIHYRSSRADNKFIELNSANLTEENIELKLFGGVENNNVIKGSLELAEGGTVFIDEISNLSLDLQSKLLKVIEDNVITREGSNIFIKLNVRFIFSSNMDLISEIDAKHFREDLYHRINVLQINLPPLREHADDIKELVEYFTKTICTQNGIPVKKFSDKAIEALESFRYPGNVRELKNLVERLIITSDRKIIDDEDIELPANKELKLYNELLNKDMSLNDFQNESEKLFIQKMLHDYKYNVSHTAEALQIQRSHLYKLMAKYDIPLPSKTKQEL